MKFCIYGYLSLLSHEDGNYLSDNLKNPLLPCKFFFFLKLFLFFKIICVPMNGNVVSLRP
jgi:hypothetical protein